jgi:hypothetical protein
MEDKESEIEMAHRHVSEGAAYIVGQRIVIGDVPAEGESAQTAKELLATLEATQQKHEQHLTQKSLSRTTNLLAQLVKD